MSSNENDPAAAPAPAANIWARLRTIFSQDSEQSLRETIEDAFASHAAAQGGTVRPEARSMMLRLLEFADLRVSDVMVPRADIIAIPEQASLCELLERFDEAGHSRLPVYRETLDDLAGLVHIKDLMSWIVKKAAPKRRARRAAAAAAAAQGATDAGAASASAATAAAGLELKAIDLDSTVKQAGIMRELIFVPPSMPASDLLVQMQASHTHMAAVVDEYGGTDGLVSIEDLVEEIVGDIADEHDTDEEAVIRQIDANTWNADARASVEEAEALLGITLLPEDREEDADTLGGVVSAMLGRVPVRGELVRHPSGIEFEVTEADPRRVKRLRIHGAKDPAPPAAGES